MTRAAHGPAALLAASLAVGFPHAARAETARPPAAPSARSGSVARAARDPDDPLRHPGTFSLGRTVPDRAPVAPAAPGAIDLDVVVTGRAAPRNEAVPFRATGADRTGRDFSAPVADMRDPYNGSRSGGTYGCRAGSLCSAVDSGGASLRDLFGD